MMSQARKEHTTKTTQETTETVDAAAASAVPVVPVVPVDPDATSTTGSAAVDDAIATQAERTATDGKVTVEQEK
jgi:hypothetical protein